MQDKKNIILDIMRSTNMFFYTTNVVLQEVPNEISLAFSISGCSLKCDGCHSSFLWKERGTMLTNDLFIEFLNKYKNTVSTILFMGGEWKAVDLLNKLEIAINMQFKTALYTGLDTDEIIELIPNILNKLDFLKTGRYNKELGGLNSDKTNQIMLDVKNNKKINKLFIK